MSFRLFQQIEYDVSIEGRGWFDAFQPKLKSFLYRLVTDRNDVEDIARKTFIKAFEHPCSIRDKSSMKTFLFRITLNLLKDRLRKKQRWQPDILERSKSLAIAIPEITENLLHINKHAPYGRYDIAEHIDFCFTCFSKTLTVEQQTALILKDLYNFSLNEVAIVLGYSVTAVKRLLYDAREVMASIFSLRCALINPHGICSQCTELDVFFNPRQKFQTTRLKRNLLNEAVRTDRRKLYRMRAKLVSTIDPTDSSGSDLHDMIMQCTRLSIGEISSIKINPYLN